MEDELDKVTPAEIVERDRNAATGIEDQGYAGTVTWWPWLHPNLSANPNLAKAVPRSRALFSRSAPLRRMVVVVDADLSEQAVRDEKVAYLLRLVCDETVESHFYDDTASIVAPVPGWLRVQPGEREDQRRVAFFRDGEFVHKVTTTDFSAYRRVIGAEPVPEYGVPGDAPVPAEGDATAMLAVKEVQADLFVTERPLPLLLGHDPWSTVTVLRPADAIPAVGLYLRLQGRFILGASTDKAHGRYPVRSVFFWQAAQTLIPSASEWSAAFDAHARTTNDNTLSLLSKALIQRIDQALRSRDRLFAALSVPQDIDSMEEALAELDQFLLWVMAAFDVSARVAHSTLALGGSIKSAGWQRESWVERLAQRDETLADLVRGNSEGRHLLKIFSLLRNSIHGPALSAAGIIPVIGPRALEPLVELPREDRNELRDAMDALGGQSVWGVGQPFPDYELHLHPGEFIEQALPRALTLLNALVEATPVPTHRGGATPLQQSHRRPRTPQETRGLWQLGLSTP